MSHASSRDAACCPGGAPTLAHNRHRILIHLTLLGLLSAALLGGCARDTTSSTAVSEGVRGFQHWIVEGRAKLVAPAIAQSRRVLLVLDWEDLRQAGWNVEPGKMGWDRRGTEVTTLKYDVTLRRDGDDERRQPVDVKVLHDYISIGSATSTLRAGQGALVFATLEEDGISPTIELLEIQPDSSPQEAYLAALGLLASRSKDFCKVDSLD